MYADRVVKNYERMLAGPSHDGNPETLKVTMLRFCAGLRNTELSTEIRRLIKTAKSMDEIVEACEEIQSTKDFLIKRNGPSEDRRYELDHDDNVQEVNKANVACFYCKKKGHFKRDCFKYKNSLKQDGEKKKTSSKSTNSSSSNKYNKSRRNKGKGGSRKSRRVQELEQENTEDDSVSECSADDEEEEESEDTAQDFQ